VWDAAFSSSLADEVTGEGTGASQNSAPTSRSRVLPSMLKRQSLNSRGVSYPVVRANFFQNFGYPLADPRSSESGRVLSAENLCLRVNRQPSEVPPVDSRPPAKPVNI
jgi:hypothetical protein